MQDHGSTHDALPSGPAAAGGVGFIPLGDLGRRSPAADAEDLRRQLQAAAPRKFWRSLEELAGTDEFRTYLEREFPHQAPGDWEPVGRRRFLQLMGATLALAGVGGCALQPAEKIVPFIENPETVVPGKPLFYATAFELGGYGRGVVAESHMGRPIKLEGNVEHPASRGATDAITQAAILTLYDPDRSQAVRHMGTPSSWDSFQMTVTGLVNGLRRTKGEGLRILTGTFTSPTLEAQCKRLLARYPQTKIHTHEPVGRDQVHAGCRAAFGRDLQPVYRLENARCILSLDANFLVDEPGSVRYARDFADRRRVAHGVKEMNRLFVAECTPTITGTSADHRIIVKPSALEALARAVLAGVQGSGGAAAPAGVNPTWLQAVVADLKQHRAEAVVITGAHQPAVIHALGVAINAALGSIGQTVNYTVPVEALFGPPESSLQDLVTDINAGKVRTLVMIGCNPAYTAPADLEIEKALVRVGLRIHMGLYDDETGALAHWHVPQTHFLESWSDVRAYDGTASIIQPLIDPLYDGHSPHELISLLLGEGPRSTLAMVREHWMRVWGMAPPAPLNDASGNPMRAESGGRPTLTPLFDRRWHEVLTRGMVPNTTYTPQAGLTATAPAPSTAAPATGIELVLRPDPTVWDGRFANSGWLQELPKPLTALTWDNALLLSVGTMRSRGISKGDLVEVTYKGRTITAAAWPLPAQADDVATLHLGYGRTRAGRLGTGAGFNAYKLRTSDAPGGGPGAELKKAGGSYQLVSSQMHFNMEGREFVKTGTFGEWHEHPDDPHFMHSKEHLPDNLPSMYEQTWSSDSKRNQAKGVGDWEGEGYNGYNVPAWGLVVDLTSCTGCSACTIACQAENNVATVGKDQVANNREMHWMRIDTWHEGPPEDPETYFQPVMCMHCEKAPCEPVCPVGATTHSPEGLNAMVYNRCIGTRYCQNNCPYKVRRFNYLQYSDQDTGIIKMLANPDVTVRSRGVMEKCTYCVQRINQARIEAEKEDRPLRDGDIVTACQQVCPTRAISFGNLADPASKVRELVQSPLNYTLLTELNTRPRTSYLANLTNPHSSLGGRQGESAAEGAAHPAGATGGEAGGH